MPRYHIHHGASRFHASGVRLARKQGGGGAGCMAIFRLLYPQYIWWGPRHTEGRRRRRQWGTSTSDLQTYFLSQGTSLSAVVLTLRTITCERIYLYGALRLLARPCGTEYMALVSTEKRQLLQ